jgi:8-oxo-dGTP pyrophosphatase MutT (NUDIX family)
MTEKPRLAATVILLRPSPRQRGFEVFLTRRHERMAFLGGMYCFPGGTLRQEDYSMSMLKRAAGLTPGQAQKIIGAEIAPRRAVGLWIAALRELFEESGILVARDSSGAPPATGLEPAKRLGEAHSKALAPAWNFACLLESEGLFCDLGALTHFSHWQTPEQIAMRFDTHFFLAELPTGQAPLPASSEVAHSLWLAPECALQMLSRNQLPMIFPTFASLRTLADFDSLESLWKEYRSENRAQ